MEKRYFGELELTKFPARSTAQMPRTAIIHIARQKQTGYLNAAPVSGGVTCINPYQFIFGIKSPDSKETFWDIEEFCVAIPSRSQINEMSVTRLAVPKGINEIEVAGWHEMPSKVIDTPGIEECPVNLECKKIFMKQLPRGHRAIIIGEVVGISIDTDILNLSRSEAIKRYPMHEASTHPKTGCYGPSVLSGELIPPAKPSESTAVGQETNRKTYVSGKAMYEPGGEDVLSYAIWPRPSYILMSMDERGYANALPICGGLLMSNLPNIQVPVPKGTFSYKNIKRTGEFGISIPIRSSIGNFECMERNTPDGFGAAGFTPYRSKEMKVAGLEECPINIYCRNVLFEDIPGADYAVLVGRAIGASLDEDLPLLAGKARPMELFSQEIYAVMDRGMVRKWGFHDVNNMTFRGLPSASRWFESWGFQYRSHMFYWLIELAAEAYISEGEFKKIQSWLLNWTQLYYSENEEITSELRARITKLCKMMAWAHRSEAKWYEIHEYLREFPEDEFRRGL